MTSISLTLTDDETDDLMAVLVRAKVMEEVRAKHIADNLYGEPDMHFVAVVGSIIDRIIESWSSTNGDHHDHPPAPRGSGAGELR